MRASSAWLVVAAASVAACVVGSIHGVPASAQDAPHGSVQVAEDTLKDVEVMRRVLVREGLARRGDAGEVLLTGTVEGRFWSSGAGVSDAFVVPGQGATFVLRTSDSVAPAAGSDDAAAGAEKPSAWDEESAALEGKSISAPAARRANRYDAAKVEALRTRVLDVLAKYGQKIRGLGGSDRITVIVVGGGGRAEYLTYTDDAKTASVYALTSALAHPGVGRTVLALHVSVADCQAAATGTLSAEEFKRRAVVSAY